MTTGKIHTTGKTHKTPARAVPMKEVAPEDVDTVALVEGSSEGLVLRGAVRSDTSQLLRPWTLPTFTSSVEAALVFVHAQVWPQGREGGNGVGGSPDGGEDGDRNPSTQKKGAKCDDSPVMSLRRYGEEERWGGARSQYDTTLGTSIEVPAFLEQVDFESVEWTTSGLQLSRPSWEGLFPLTATTSPSAPPTGATVSCLVEGSQQVWAAPLLLTWARLQCGGDLCFMDDDDPEMMGMDENNKGEDIYKTTSGHNMDLKVHFSDILPGDCVYLPAGWTGWTRTLKSSVNFDLVWKDDLMLILHEDDPLWKAFSLWDEEGILCEDQELCDEGSFVIEEEEDDDDDTVCGREDPHLDMDHLTIPEVSEGEDFVGHKPRSSSSGEKEARASPQASASTPSSGRSPTLADHMPENLRRRRKILWSDQDPVPHLVGRYLLAPRSKNLEEFTEELMNDGALLPHLVECPAECHLLILDLFRALDLDGDLRLTGNDLTCLTLRDLDSLTHSADEALNDLRDLIKDQWSNLKESRPEEVSSFLQKAKERQEASARATARGLMEGALSLEQEEQLKRNLPDLYDQILNARKQREKELKEEL